MSEWICIDDKRPKIGEYILGVSPQGDDGWSYRIGTVIRVLRKPSNIVVLKEWGSRTWHPVSHWMPLPEHPKE